MIIDKTGVLDLFFSPKCLLGTFYTIEEKTTTPENIGPMSQTKNTLAEILEMES
jgi:hypothetical protein